MSAGNHPPAGEDAAEKGWWEPIRSRFNYLPVHMAVLHTGKVLAFGGSGNDPRFLSDPHPAELWNPETGQTSIIDQRLDGDIFCVGHDYLADGRLLIAGGTFGYEGNLLGLRFPPFRGLEQTYLFDPVTERWLRDRDMATGRWYPTLVTLGDGRVLVMAGLTKHFPYVKLSMIEIHTPGEGWQRLEFADRWMPLYPRLHLLPNGEVFYAGSFNTHYTYPFAIRGFPTAALNVNSGAWRDIGLPEKYHRQEGASVLLPLVPPDYRARVLLVGGGTPGGTQAVADAEIIEPTALDARWTTIASMQHARYHVYPVILPDGEVLVIGGRSGEKHGHPPAAPPMEEPHEVPHDPLAVLEPELFNPKTRQWTAMAPMQVDRLYHANALLLPDGRVMTAGSNPERGMNELRIEIFHPPYLFKGPRPKITGVPATIPYGGLFDIETTDEVTEVALIRSATTTHCLTTSRYISLPFTPVGFDRVAATVPPNRNLAPPGYYMLFILSEGIPSEAKFVRLQ